MSESLLKDFQATIKTVNPIYLNGHVFTFSQFYFSSLLLELLLSNQGCHLSNVARFVPSADRVLD
jgi:hypothetical protein